MIVIECGQGSDEWLRARSGVITASMFSVARKRVGGLTEQQAKYVEAIKSGAAEGDARAIAGYKTAPRSDAITRALAGERVGDWSSEAKDYAFRLAVERISGEPLDEGFETWSMRRGRELEPEARMEHEAATGLLVRPCGFIMTDDGAFGASADGLFGDDGGAEYKCFVSPEKLRGIYIDDDFSSCVDQVQGGMWITGRMRWHFGLYCPALSPIGRQFWWREVARDDDYIEAMETDLMEFKSLVDSYESALRGGGA